MQIFYSLGYLFCTRIGILLLNWGVFCWRVGACFREDMRWYIIIHFHILLWWVFCIWYQSGYSGVDFHREDSIWWCLPGEDCLYSFILRNWYHRALRPVSHFTSLSLSSLDQYHSHWYDICHSDISCSLQYLGQLGVYQHQRTWVLPLENVWGALVQYCEQS